MTAFYFQAVPVSCLKFTATARIVSGLFELLEEQGAQVDLPGRMFSPEQTAAVHRI